MMMYVPSWTLFPNKSLSLSLSMACMDIVSSNKSLSLSEGRPRDYPVMEIVPNKALSLSLSLSRGRVSLSCRSGPGFIIMIKRRSPSGIPLQPPRSGSFTQSKKWCHRRAEHAAGRAQEQRCFTVHNTGTRERAGTPLALAEEHEPPSAH